MAKKLVSMVNAKCGGVSPDGASVAIGSHEVQLKAYEDGSTMPLACKYMHENKNAVGEYVYDPSLRGGTTHGLNKCRLWSKE